MRAVIFDGSLSYRPDEPDPQPGPGECLVRVHLAGICGTDLQILDGFMNFRGILGHEMVGTVVQGSPRWKGRRVAAEINYVCRHCDMCHSGLSSHCRRRTVMGISGRNGCFADFLAVPEANLHNLPETISDEEAVFVEPLAAAYQVTAQCPIEPRMNVSVVGSGRLGILVAQVLAQTGCKLTVVGRNPAKLLLCEKRGIQTVVLDELCPRADRDVVVDCSGSPSGLEVAMSMVRPRGTIVLKSTHVGGSAASLAPIVVHEVRLLGSRCGPFPEAIHALARRAVEVRPLISRTFSADQAVAAFKEVRKPDVLKVLLRFNAS
jgi:alcohol dehydrogenase